MSSAFRTDHELVAEVVEGSEPAWCLLVCRHQRRLSEMVAWLLVKEIPNAEERDRAARMLVKETFQAARRTIQDCPADKLFSAWLYQTALRRAVWHRMEREAEGNRPTDEKLMAAVSELPPELRAVFVLHRLEGMDEPEIARTLNLAVGTVRQRLHRARLELVELLQGPG